MLGPARLAGLRGLPRCSDRAALAASRSTVLVQPCNGFVLSTFISAALGLLAISLLERTARRQPSTTKFELLVLIGGCLTAFTCAKLGGYGRLDDAITLACAVLALHQVRSGQPLSVGLAIGIAIATKPWRVIFLPLTLASRPRYWREPVVACVVAAVVASVHHRGSRLVGGPSADGQHRPASVLDLSGVTNAALPDWMRIAQLIACIATATVLLFRQRPESVIAAAIDVRIATDRRLGTTTPLVS